METPVLSAAELAAIRCPVIHLDDEDSDSPVTRAPVDRCAVEAPYDDAAEGAVGDGFFEDCRDDKDVLMKPEAPLTPSTLPAAEPFEPPR